jgi:phosphoserine phosphatase
MPGLTAAAYNLGNSRQRNRMNAFQRRIKVKTIVPPQIGIFCSDFDGTLIKGIITEGSSYYKGISEHLYELGLAKTDKYKTYHEYSSEYFRRWDKNDSGSLAMPYEIYDDSKDAETKQAIIDYWESTLKNYFVKETTDLLKKKSNEGNKIWIVSGSPRIYIEPITRYLPFIEKIVAVESDNTSYAITYSAGKASRIKNANGGNFSGIVGYIGDSWNNDGPPLSAIKNYNKFADVIFVDHFSSLAIDTIQNLKLHGIKRMKIQVY